MKKLIAVTLASVVVLAQSLNEPKPFDYGQTWVQNLSEDRPIDLDTIRRGSAYPVNHQENALYDSMLMWNTCLIAKRAEQSSLRSEIIRQCDKFLKD
jgi:hypothetical protein